MPSHRKTALKFVKQQMALAAPPATPVEDGATLQMLYRQRRIGLYSVGHLGSVVGFLGHIQSTMGPPSKFHPKGGGRLDILK